MPDYPVNQSHVHVFFNWATQQQWVPGECLQTRFIDADMTYALWLIRRGSVDVTLKGRSWHLTRGHVFLCPLAAERHIVTPDGAEWLSVGLQATLFGKIDLFRDLTPPIAYTPTLEARTTMEGWLQQLVEYAGSQQASHRLICQGIATVLVGYCCQIWHISTSTLLDHRDIPEWLEAVIRAMQESPGTSVAALAGLANYSEPHFRRLFAQWTGLSPHEYLQRYRLDVAKQLLGVPEVKIALIADRLGFTSHAHFSRLFHKRFGVSPTNYRQAVTLGQI